MVIPNHSKHGTVLSGMIVLVTFTSCWTEKWKTMETLHRHICAELSQVTRSPTLPSLVVGETLVSQRECWLEDMLKDLQAAWLISQVAQRPCAGGDVTLHSSWVCVIAYKNGSLEDHYRIELVVSCDSEFLAKPKHVVSTFCLLISKYIHTSATGTEAPNPQPRLNGTATTTCPMTSWVVIFKQTGTKSR